MICELTKQPTTLLKELKKNREFLLINIRFAEEKILKEFSENKKPLNK